MIMYSGGFKEKKGIYREICIVCFFLNKELKLFLDERFDFKSIFDCSLALPERFKSIMRRYPSVSLSTDERSKKTAQFSIHP